MSSVNYVNASVTSIYKGLSKKERKLELKFITPINSIILVVLETLDEFDEEGIQYF